ncbi:MAG: anion permease, partial [Planctomycetes bacterium]|nr:anion permease [Planctomycetota bacterium]
MSDANQQTDRSLAARIGLPLGLLLAIGLLVAQQFGFALDPARPQLGAMAAITLLMAVWWMTEALPLAATALVPLVAFPLCNIMPSSDVAAQFGNKLIFLFLGGFLIALAVERSGLHRRIALLIVRTIGDSPRRVVLGFMLATAALSMWLSNTATTVMMLPIALSILAQAEAHGDGSRNRRMAVALMLGIAYAASIGGIGTLIGTPTNVAFAGYWENTWMPAHPGTEEITFFHWMTIALPFVVVMLLATWAMLVWVICPVGSKRFLGGRSVAADELAKLGPMTPAQWRMLAIFLTTALDDGRQRVVFCIDRRSGRTLWEQVAWTGEPEKSHRMNGHASATCATNGKVVVAFFGRGGLHAYSLDGKHLWSRDLGPFDGPWGTAASPIFYGDIVIQNCDSESPEASLVAVDYRTGETVWNTPRPVIRGWSTPVLINTLKREDPILNGHHGVRGYDPKTGEELWWCKGFNGRGEPVPAYAHGLLYVVNGLFGDIYAVRPGGKGEVTDTHRVWHTPRRAGRDMPSPVVIDNYLLACSMAGILLCYDTHTGKELWKERIGPKFTSTPLVSDGRAYFHSEEGDTVESFDLPLRPVVERAFAEYSSLVLFLSAGASIRLLAPCLESKKADPAVVCVDDAGSFCVSLVSGHVGGADRLAQEVARHLKATPVITSASHASGTLAVDLLGREYGWRLTASSTTVTRASAAVINARSVGVWQGAGEPGWWP